MGSVPDRPRLLHATGLPGRLRALERHRQRSEPTREVEMISSIRRLVTIGAAALAVGLMGAAFLAFAQEASQPGPEICVTPGTELGAETPFLAENDAAMKTMMRDMTVTPTGDVDADFVAMMV